MDTDLSQDLRLRINEEHDLSRLIALVSKEGSRLLNAEGIAILFYDRERCELWSPVKIEGQLLRLDARLGIAGSCVDSGEVINVTNAQHDQRFYAGIDAKTKHRTRSLLAVPLLHPGGDLIGVFEAVNKRGGDFTSKDERVAVALGAQVVVPLGRARLVEQLRFQQQQLEEENKHLWKEVEGRFATQNLIGNSPRMQGLVRLIDQIRESSVDVLITGENGSGKELVAKAIHYNSPRSRKPFVALNCAALPETLVESELFGIKKGVATGVEARIGKFEQANGGSIFLDEIGDLSLGAQAKILRVLQERTIERVGEQVSVPLDVRVLAATNANLEEAIKKKIFREDLFYRLNVVPIRTPSLREIPDDIPVLAHYFLHKYCRQMERELKKFSVSALRRLTAYSWPGNVRQLENEVKRLVVMVRRTTISEEDLEEGIRRISEQGVSASGFRTLPQAVEELERRMIEEALLVCRHNQVQTAKRLGLSRQGLIKKIKRYQVTAERI